MLEDVFDTLPDNVLEEFNLMEAGKGIGDSGATKPVVGIEIWKEWMVKLKEKALLKEVRYEKCRQFRFGNQQVLTAKNLAIVPVMVYGVLQQL